MGKKRIGVGIIGGGFIARFHIRSWLGVRDADILGVVSRKEDTAKETAALARKWHVGEARAYRTITDMIANPHIDALWICAPNFTRIEVMEEIVHALESGKGEPQRSTAGPTCRGSGKESSKAGVCLTT